MNGLQALSYVKARLDQGLPLYKLILMDYSMPEMDGPTATKKIRSLVEKHA